MAITSPMTACNEKSRGAAMIEELLSGFLEKEINAHK
jgi:hypothetical protein